MNHNYNNFKSPHMNYAVMKYRLTNTVNNSNANQRDREPMSSVVSSFRQSIPKQKKSSSKYKTSKNSRKPTPINHYHNYHYSLSIADRVTDRSSKSKAKNQLDLNSKDNLNEGSLSKKTSSVNGSNSRFVLSMTTKSKEKKGFECLLKRKIIKMKEKNKDRFNTNLHAQTNYISKIKNKITLDTSAHHVKLTQTNMNVNVNVNTQSQKRSNSTLDDEEKYSRPPSTKKNMFNILTNPSASGMIHNHFNHHQKDSNMNTCVNMKKANLVSSTKINSILNPNHNKKQYNINIDANINTKLHFDFNTNPTHSNITSKTSFPTKHNSRKQSTDKMMTYKAQMNNKGHNQFRGSAIKMQCKAKIITEGTPNMINKKEDKLHLKVLSEIRYDSSLKKQNDHSSSIKENDSELWNIIKKSINREKGVMNSTNPMEEVNEILKGKLKSNKVPVTTCHSPNDCQIKIRSDINQEIEENGTDILKKKRKSLKLNKKGRVKESEREKQTVEDTHCNRDNHQYQCSNITIDSLHSTLRESRYYLQEMDYLSNYIRQYYRDNSAYPKTEANFYLFGRLLGKGAFGKVNLALNVLTGRLVAIKSINKKKLTSEHKKSKIALETSIMKKLKHESIVQIYETFETDKYILISMEYLCAGDLLSFIKKRAKLTEPIAKMIFKQIIEALAYIHSQNIVHRDIKLDNILMDLDNNVKICDFGVSKKLAKGDIMTEQCGTLAYIAPEILKNKGYEGFTVDIWSAGVVLYAMLSGTVPFKGNNIKELHQLILKGSVHTLSGVSEEANHLIQCLLEIEPRKRITISQILSHPWLINVNTKNKSKVTLFTKAEQILLAKSNIDYRTANKIELIENFTLRNLDSLNEISNQNIHTKSLILAPFNSSVTNDEDSLSIKEENNVLRFEAQVRELNRNYELNNNKEIDNGQIIPLESNGANVNKDFTNDYESSFSKKISAKPFSPLNELIEDNTMCMIQKTVSSSLHQTINYDVMAEVEKLGYRKSYLKSCLETNEINYATTCYYLLLKHHQDY